MRLDQRSAPNTQVDMSLLPTTKHLRGENRVKAGGFSLLLPLYNEGSQDKTVYWGMLNSSGRGKQC